MAAESMIDDLGDFLKQQRHSAQMSLRQLATAAGVSNPYLSQIERGLRRPSAEVLQQIARGLQISATALYARAGLLDEPPAGQSDAAGDHPADAAGDRPADAAANRPADAAGDHRADAARSHPAVDTSVVVSAITGDPHLDPAQRRALIDVYLAFVLDGRPHQEQT